ncbi:MAG: helix-turn-helix transcriptional regulator [Clostridiaceae bacterium]|jgi:transcriptional regulator with XRE-family HTH domain|nr:helix-turn-helix transcriptional regulator [Clostridiaceae bacterium]
MLGNKEVMARNIQYFLNKTGMTQAELAEKLGVNKSTISTWIAAKKYPRIDKIEIMANLCCTDIQMERQDKFCLWIWNSFCVHSNPSMRFIKFLE